MILLGHRLDQHSINPDRPAGSLELTAGGDMRLVLNVIWLVFGGLWLALGYFAAGILCFVLIITLPFGVAAFRIGVYALWPFGYTVVDKPGPRPGAAIGNVI